MPLSMSNIEKIAVFGFGIIFLSAILVLVVLIPMPSITQFFAFRLTMALSAAGIGALLPGFLRLDVLCPCKVVSAPAARWRCLRQFGLRTGDLGIEVQPPKEDARLLIDRFLNLTDARDHKAAYTLYSKRNKERVSEDAYMSMSKQVRDPLGSIGQRLLVSAGTPDEVNGVRGPFVFHTYQGRFSDSKDVWAEVVSTIPENGTWRINSYNIGRCDPPFCIPVASLLP